MTTRSAQAASQGWHRIRLTREEYEGGEAAVLEDAFRRIYIASNGPRGMAMLGAWEEGGYSVYFTPSSLPHALALVRAYSASPGAPPVHRNLALLCGDPVGITETVLEC
jgi:hypothetical protein